MIIIGSPARILLFALALSMLVGLVARKCGSGGRRLEIGARARRSASERASNQLIEVKTKLQY